MNWESKFLEAFDGFPPSNPTIAISASNLIDDFENLECRRILLGKKWRDVDRQILATQGQFYLYYLTEESLCYYMPSIFLAALENICLDFNNSVESYFVNGSTVLRSALGKFSLSQLKILELAVEQMFRTHYGDSVQNEEDVGGEISRIQRMFREIMMQK